MKPLVTVADDYEAFHHIYGRLTGDVGESADVDRAVADAEAELGPLGILVCAAGVTGDSLATVDVADDEWRRVLQINCDGVFWANRAAARR